jgi:PKD domain-containing protein/CHAP domain-containing protein
MTGIRPGRFGWRPTIPALAGLALIAMSAAPASAGTQSAGHSPSPAGTRIAAGTTQGALAQAFTAARHVAGSAVGSIRPGSLHTGTADGRQWAIASFLPKKSDSAEMAISFQDGAATGVFEKTHGSWRLVSTGLYGCAVGLPASLKKAWHIGSPSLCTRSASSQEAAARKALAAMPAGARATASKAVKAAAAAKSAVRTAAADPADLGQTIASIALTQVGVQVNPQVPNFATVDCDPYSTMVAGFSADSDGCGYNAAFKVQNENETWCADFNKWVWQQAGITADMNTLNAGAVSFDTWAVQQGQNPQLDTGTPQAGDSVLFYNPYNFPGFADHVGIITSVSADGTIDMVNGDFSASPAIHAEYDTGITNLSAFAASVEGPGEEWALVTPPTTAEQPNPAGHMLAPRVAVDGSTASFSATGSVPGGTITGYYWTFGDTRMTNEDGADVTHVFSEPGTYTATVTITSSFGTTTTLRQNIHVLASSSSVASAPNDQIWYDSLPVQQYTFTRSASGLAADYWDGGAWLQLPVPGAPDATGNIAALTYPDPADMDANGAHAYYRSSGGSLAETYQVMSVDPASGNPVYSWATQDLPGSPVAGSAINATTTVSGYPEVFFVNASHQLAVTADSATGWTTRTLSPVPVTNPGSLSLTDTTSGPQIFGIGPLGLVTVTTALGPVWVTVPLPAFAAKGSSLSATNTATGQAQLFYTTPSGSLSEATQAGLTWNVASLPGSPTASGGLAATTYLLPSVVPSVPGTFPNPPGTLTDTSVTNSLGTEVFYLTASGSPAVTYNDGTGWATQSLPGTASSVAGATAYQVTEEPSNLFLSGASGLSEETTGARSGDPSGTWNSPQALPDTPATWANQIVLYAADSGDASVAQAAAAAAGLPASSVVTSYEAAWADTLSGQYIVLAVGTPAVAALYYNVCGWANPSALPAYSTPFSYQVEGPPPLPMINTVQEEGPGNFINSASDTAADTQALTTDLAYYALHGSLPAGVTPASMPAAVGAPFACIGSPG